MEIEAKFAVPDQETFQRLRAMGDLCGYPLSASQAREVHDTYLDTVTRQVLAAGFFCRRRESPQGISITLKALTQSAEAVHRREEWEMSLPNDAPLPDWPASPVRDQLLQWAGDAPLAPLVELRQTRHTRTVTQGERIVAELSLDEVAFDADSGPQATLEAEIELKAEGNENDLAALVTCLRTDWGLTPEPRSKFERALARLDASSRAERLLHPEERAIVLRIATRQGRYGRRARALLALDEGAAVRQAGQRGPLSPPRVRHWLRLLKQKRLDIFPPHVRAGTPDQNRHSGATHAQGTLAATPVLHPAPTGTQAPPQFTSPRIQLPDSPGIELDDSMAEAARKTLYFHLQRALYHEPGTRQGTNIEELHDMRVATRRMRAALRVFGEHIHQQEMAPFAKALRRTGRTLGAVRDLDVFHEKMQAYLDTLPTERKAELDPLLLAWQAQRERARQEMIAYLDSPRYARFRERFSQFLQTPDSGALPPLTQDGDLIPYRVRHVAPVIVHTRLASVRAHGEWVAAPDTPLERFHRLRIASKELRYALEFFQEVLAPESKALVGTMKALQDHLGNLQDAVVACNLLRDFLTWGTWGHENGAEQRWPAAPVVAPGVATYLAVRQTEIQTLVQAFPSVWTQLSTSAFRKRVEAALRPLWSDAE